MMDQLIPIFIMVGVFGLLYFMAFALLLASCGRLHHLEGVKAWRVAWYSILIELSLLSLTVLTFFATIYSITKPSMAWPEWIGHLNTWINHASNIAHTVVLGTLTLALAHPLRKSKLSASGIEGDQPNSD